MKGSFENRPIKNDIFLLKLIKGNVPLVITYWVFGVLAGIVFKITNIAIDINYSDLYNNDKIYLIKGYYYFIIIYSIFIWIAIWNSAGNYKGEKGWATLARIAVLVSIIIFVVDFYTSEEQALKKEIKPLNYKLPVMIDNETQFDSVSFDGNDIFYNYKLVNLNVANIDILKFNNLIASKLRVETCNDKIFKKLLSNGKTVNYLYRDKENRVITKITVINSDCF